jgi:hypothetical protein
MDQPKQSRPILKAFLYFSGFLFLGLGILGLFLPLLPTTPFLLLAASVFMHTNKKMYYWMFNNRYFGKSFSNYVKNRSVSRSVKISSLLLLSITMAYSIIFVSENIWIRLMLIVIAIAVSYHILKLKTIDDKIEKL